MMVNCPVCDSHLRIETLKGTDLGVCEDCDGLWLPAGAMDEITGESIEGELRSWLGEPDECRYCGSMLGFSDKCLSCGEWPTVACSHGHGVMNAGLVAIQGREFEADCCRTCGGIWIDGHERVHLEEGARTGSAREFPARGPESSTSKWSFLLKVLDEPNRMADGAGPAGRWIIGGPTFGPSPGTWGRREPMQLIVGGLFLLGLLFAVYHFVGPTLVSF